MVRSVYILSMIKSQNHPLMQTTQFILLKDGFKFSLKNSNLLNTLPGRSDFKKPTLNVKCRFVKVNDNKSSIRFV